MSAEVETLQELPGGKRQLHLTGFMGSGKSTVGQLLARELLWNFLDLDGVIERHAERSIREIFEQEGEGAFRGIERHVLRQVVQKPRTVVALGGGTLIKTENLQLCRGVAEILWLDCPLELIRARLGGSALARPLWGTEDEMSERHAERLPGYRGADFQIDAGVAPDLVVAAVLEALGLGRESG